MLIYNLIANEESNLIANERLEEDWHYFLCFSQLSVLLGISYTDIYNSLQNLTVLRLMSGQSIFPR